MTVVNILKLSGGVLVLVGSLFWALERRARMKERIRVLESLSRFIQYAKREIDCYRTPFPEIITAFKDATLEKYSFSVNVREAAGEMPLQRDEREELLRFLSSIGAGFADDEIKLCESFSDFFSRSAEKQASELPRRSRTEIALAFLIGATTLILLI